MTRLVAYRASGQCVLGFEHSPGRIERLLEAADEPGAFERLHRLADASNACEGLSDKLLAYLASPQNTVSLAERVVGWNLLVSQSRNVASRLLKQAQAIIEKNGGQA